MKTKQMTVGDLKKLLDEFPDDIPVYKFVNLNFDYHDPEDHVLEETSLNSVEVYYDKDEEDYRVVNKPTKKTSSSFKAIVI